MLVGAWTRGMLDALFCFELTSTLAANRPKIRSRPNLLARIKNIIHLHKHMNRLQEQSVIFCLTALNNLAKMDRRNLTQGTDFTSLAFSKDLHALVIEMAHANTEMVDTFFIIKFLLKMSETNDIKDIVSAENMKKILELFNGKILDENGRLEIAKYTSHSDLYAIAQTFGRQLPGFTEMCTQRWLEKTNKIGNSQDFKDVVNLK